MTKKQKPFEKAEDSGHDRKATTATDDEIAQTLAQMGALHEVPERSPGRVESGRQAFLTQAHDLGPAVSNVPKSRLMGWTSIFRKERSPMFTLARIVLLAAFALGGTGATAYAAQESLPNQALYPVKTWIEDVRLALSSGPQADFDLLQVFAAERIDEIEALVGMGLPVTNQVATRLQQQLQQMLKIAASMDDPALIQAMEQLQVRSQVQVQLLEQLRENAPDDAAVLGLATQAMHNIRSSAEDAINDPVTFRLRQGTNRNDDAPVIPENPGPNSEGIGPSEGSGQGPQGPGNGKGPG